MEYGFITGFPRSGSAWIANYLSYGRSCMLHDAWRDYKPTEIKLMFDGLEYCDLCGTSDPANAQFFDSIDKEFPTAKWVLITRPIEDVKESCKKLDYPIGDFTKGIDKIVKTKEVLKVPFKELFDRADEIGRFLYSDWSCPTWRSEQLKMTNVQIHWDKISEQFKIPQNLLKTEALTPAKVKFFRLTKEICDDNPFAIRFMSQMRDVSELYRQLDQGKPINIKRAKEVLELMTTEWIASPFLRQFGNAIVPSIVSAIEKYKNEKDLKHCPIDTELVTAVTYIFKGNDGVNNYMPQIRALSDQIMQEGH